MKRAIRRLCEQADFAKSIPLVGMVDVVHRVGYRPVMIVNYRAFQDYARSVWLSRPSWGVPELIERYVSTYSTALLALEVFGGCTIGYDELVDPAEVAWAEALAEVAPVSRGALLQSRSQRVDASITGKERGNPLLEKASLDPRVDLVYDAMRSLKGKTVPPESSR